jgi:hypothetical protein
MARLSGLRLAVVTALPDREKKKAKKDDDDD